ncbi:endoplasmic reticulum lectin 1 isoform X1 [Gopherus flavomarginatus]|uniref:endoplasmic reticulum lectin 1 isoform X1 n=2 Tax=Gopherus flavomarginatus TaxID=286002 RepID=UPI0021CBA6E1|nr:endoplasmic reticulum lectin 1 isoform X1 [Gopherus flavomarginatus]
MAFRAPPEADVAVCGCDWVAAVSLPVGPCSPPPGGMRRWRLGPAALLALLGGVLAGAGGGGRALPPLSDDVPFRVNWPGTDFSLPTAGVLYKEDNYIIMTTVDKEKYKCILPLIANGDEEEEKDYKGPSPGELLEPLFKQSSCSYRIESYWTYEVCHGKYIRQYHEEKETGQKINIQEYYLGNMLIKSPLSDPDQDEKENLKEIPTKNIEGQTTPYYPVGMGNGTPCTLRQNLPRSSTVMYICHPEAKHEILSVAEVTTCEYEVVILTPLLCNHPKYRFRASPVNDIFCQSLPGSPLKPHNLEQLEQQQEMLKMPFRRIKEEEIHSTKEEKFSSIHKPVAVGSQQLVTVGTTHISRLTDDQLIKEFLSGSYCFHGGVGWWKYEFCYGKYVHQYHEDKESGKTSVVVGTWNKEEHIEWARKNVARAYHLRKDGMQTVRVVSHFYGNGDVCDLTDKPRQVTVKLKCKESDSPHAVTVYMLEPHSCQYILGVESPVICKILDTADENGLLSVPN